MTLAEAIAHQEGFFVAGSKPNRQNNPGDLRHAPGESHEGMDPNAVGEFANAEEGWAALNRQLNLYASRGLTIEQMIQEYAPPSENNSQAYLQAVCNLVSCHPTDLVSQVLGSASLS